jgi:hypothetical protein
MTTSIKAEYEIDLALHTKDFKVNKIQDFCPLCHSSIKPVYRYAWVDKRGLQAVFECPRENCQKLFIAYYRLSTADERSQLETEYYFSSSEPIRIKEKAFSGTIANISPQFCEVYNEAHIAEQRRLKNICGAGFRRALEFLIRDYLIHEKKDEKEEIEHKSLLDCIEQYVDDSRIKECAKMAAWLSDGESHYYRKWGDKDLNDLKVIIDLTVNWIESENLAKKIIEEKSEPKKRKKKKKRKKEEEQEKEEGKEKEESGKDN